MRGILRRTVNSGSTSSLRCGITRVFRNHMQLVAIAVVLSLLLASLPASAITGEVVNTQNRAQTGVNNSATTQLYRSVSRTLASIGTWMASVIKTDPSTDSNVYQPVPAPPFIDAPANLTVTAASSSSISLSWTAPSGTVAYYVLERSENVNGPFTFLANVTGATTKNDTSVSNLHAYLYRVRAVSSTGAISTPSNMALGTAISFQFQELDGQLIRAQHFHDVRIAINLVRGVANLSAESWDRGNLVGLEVKADDVNEMRTALNAALQGLSISFPPYEDPTLNVGANGTLIKAIHIEQLQTRSTRGSSTSSGPLDPDSSTARLDPLNETGGGGENPLSRNFNWNLPLVNLPGRAGLDLGLTLSYNSLVWTKIGSSAISFDDDNGFPGPGFRLGFPVIQQPYFNTQVGKEAYLLISPDGSRTELRQVGTSDLYEAADSSHLLLDSNTMILRTADGTQFSYGPHGGEFQCTEIKDRNGNYISINYNASGRIANIHDTLGRVITFNYDNDWLSSITQTWKKPTNLSQTITHTWASFTYADLTIQTNFNGLSVFGLSSSTIKVLSKVTLDDNSTTPAQNSHFDFDYTPWGQVWKISNYAADNHLLSYRSYKLPGSPLWTNPPAQTDCPRFTERRDWAEKWNLNGGGTEQEAITSYSAPQSGTTNVPGKAAQSATFVQVTNPDGTSTKSYFLGAAGTTSGWQVGLEYLVNTYDCLDANPTNPCSSPSLVKQQETIWTQDDETKSYVVNPRVIETNAHDPSGNRRRTRTVYETLTFADQTSCRLPKFVHEYKSDASNYLRTSEISYVDHTNYAPKRVIGLVSAHRLRDGNETGTVVSWVSYGYDESGSIDGTNTPIRHDSNAYGPGVLAGRGNLTSVTRHNVSTGTTSTTTRKYDRAGSVVSLKDPLLHEVKFGYQDNFSDGVSRQAFAYPKTITDPDNFITTSTYNFDFGAVASAQTPKPNINSYQAGPIRTTHFDDLGRVERVTNSVNAAYTRYEYAQSGNRLDVFSSMKTGASQQNGTEGHTFVVFDGVGRVIGSATKRPAGNFNGQRFEYDVIGRRVKTYNPTETSAIGSPSGWTATGADSSTGWKFTQQTFDWKDRLKLTTNQDGTTRTAEYTGCGCAGGEVVTLTDEGTLVNGVNKRRKQTLHHDVLGRLVKTEVWDFEGTAPDGVSRRLDSTTVTTYNVRDQATLVRQYAGAEGATTFQDTTMTYDGFGRLETQHLPHQQAVPNQSWTSDHTTFHYDAEDKLDYTVDARGVKKQFSYANNNRHLVTGLSFDLSALPAGQTVVLPTSAATFEYDAVGLRKKMTDGTGTITYNYNDLSQMVSEVREFTQIAGQTYTLNYEYELAGQLKKITDHNNSTINYNYDTAGQLSAVTGEGTLTANVSNYASGFEYRAWGAIRSFSFGNGTSQQTQFNSRFRPTSGSITGLAPGVNPVSWTYDYYDDARQKHAYNSFDDRFDRLLEYDHVGRLKTAYSGREARGLAPTTPYPDSPYQQSFQYDAFNNRTQKNGRFWRTPQSGSTPCVPRQQTDGCDSEGNLHNNGVEIRFYDAASKQMKFEDWRYPVGGSPNHPDLEPGVEIQQTYDSDGRPAKRIETRRTEELIGSGPNTNILLTETQTYFVYSTVLGGAKVIELGGGHVSTTYVYANGWRIAKQNIESVSTTNSVTWNHVNPGSNSYVESFSDGGILLEERDPDGAEVGLEDPWASVLEPATYENLKDEEPLYLEGGNPFDYSAGLTIDGLPVTQAEFNRRMGNGSAGVQVSVGGRPIAFVTNQHQLRQITLDIFQVDNELAGLPQSQRWGGTYYVGTIDILLDFQDRVGPTPVPSEVWSAKPDVPGVRDKLHEMLTTNDSACGAFIEQLLNRLSTDKNPRINGTALDLFDMVTKQGGLVRGGLARKHKVGATIDGHLIRDNGKKKGNASIHLGDSFVLQAGPPAARVNAVNELDAAQVLHELVHLAGQKEYYDDRRVAQVLADWLKVPGLPNRKDYKSEREFIGANSTYYQTILRSKCPPLK